MKKRLAVLLCALALCVVAGCKSPDKAFVSAVDEHTSVILPEYKDYVKADANLSDSDKDIRTKSADALVELIETAKKGGEASE